MSKAGNRDMLRTAGTTLIVAGAFVASPLDEAVVAASTGGLSLPTALIQGPTSFVGGLLTMVVGATLLYVAETQ